MGQPQCPSCNSLLRAGDVHCRMCGARASSVVGSAAPPLEEDPILAHLSEATGDEFEIIKRLGQGGMGSVYLARESALQRFVAIKVLAPEFIADENLLERFRTEARIVATLRHRSIIGIHAVRHTANLHFFVMDYVEGASLNDVIKSHGPLDISTVRSVLYEVGTALTYAHRQGGGVIHRDIKPANIMLDSDGAVVVMDFGISKPMGTKAGLTMDGSIIGTPEYMSPEQCRGNDLTVASDQYSLGLLGYAMLSGAPPFTGLQWAVISDQISVEPPHIKEIRPDCPDDLADSIHQMLKKGPRDRWDSIQEGIKAFGGRHHDIGDPVRDQIALLVKESAGATSTQIPVSRIVVAAPTSQMTPGDEIEFDVEMFDDLGRVLSGRQVHWSTSDPNIVMISPEDGRALARAPGTVRLTATVGGIDQALDVTVVAPQVDSIVIEPGSVQLRPEESVRLAAVIKDPSGRVLQLTPLWSSTNEGVATVSTSGDVLARGEGTATVSAEIAGETTTASIAVGRFTMPMQRPAKDATDHATIVAPRAGATVAITPLSVASIKLSDPPDSVSVGARIELTATPLDAHGTKVHADVAWSSSDAAIALVAPDGIVNALGAGKVKITARAGGATGSVRINIAKPQGQVSAKGKPKWLFPLAGLSVTAAAVFGWLQFSRPTPSPNPESGGATQGPSASDAGTAASGTAPGAVVVASIALAGPSDPVTVGDTVQLTATALDAQGGSLTAGQLTWRVDNAEIASVDASDGVLIASAAGAVRVFATSSDGVEGTAELTVEPRAASGPSATARVSLSVANRSMTEGASQTYRVDAHGADGTPIQQGSGGLSVRSSSTAVTVDAPNGRITANSPGRALIFASAGGLTDTVEIVVRAAVARVVIQGLFDPTLRQLPRGGRRINVGDTLALHVEVRGRQDQVIEGRTVVWTVSNPDFVSVDQNGRVRAIAPGAVQVTATVDGVEGNATVIVEPPGSPAPSGSTPR